MNLPPFGGWYWAAALALGFVLHPATARADAKACVDAHGEGQERRDESNFTAAAELFQRCAADACPRPIRSECREFLSALEARTPTVIVTARDASGADVPDATVELDGKPFLERLSGLAVPLNPGEHTFVFRHPNGSEARTRTLILEGKKSREIVGVFAAPATTTTPAATPAAATSGQRKTVAYVLGGAGAIALGAFTYFALSGKAAEDELRDSCAPNCSEDDSGAVGTKYLLADISLVAALGLLGTGAYFYFTAPSEPATGHAFSAGVRGRF
jgi:hypothetical protein